MENGKSKISSLTGETAGGEFVGKVSLISLVSLLEDGASTCDTPIHPRCSDNLANY